MGKKNIKKTKKSAPKAAESSVAKKEAKRLVTMAALEAMTDSEDDEGMPPEGEWGADAKALKKAIESGAFETVLNAYKEGEDDESIEEVNIDVSDEEEGDDGSEDAGDDQGEEVEEVNEEEEEGVEEEEDDDEDEEEEVDDNSESDAPAKAADKPQHKKSVLASKDDEDDEQAEVEDDDDEKEEVENVNSKAIRVVTEDLIAVRNAMPWAESFAITPATTSPFAPGAEEPLDIHDDLKREVAFYDIAMEAALAAKKACEEASVPFSRPEDFFAEMVKTDGKDPFSQHMQMNRWKSYLIRMRFLLSQNTWHESRIA
jgi:rRNA-processing protein EBP2